MGALLAVPTVAVIYKILKQSSSERLDRKHIKLSRVVTAEGASVVECAPTDEHTEASDAKDKTAENDIVKDIKDAMTDDGDDKE